MYKIKEISKIEYEKIKSHFPLQLCSEVLYIESKYIHLATLTQKRPLQSSYYI